MTSLTDEPATKRRRVGASSSSEELPSQPGESPLQLRNRLLEENACALISRELDNAGDFEDKVKERVLSEIAAVMRSAIAKLAPPRPSRLLAVPFAVLKNGVFGFLNIKEAGTCARVCKTVRAVATEALPVACRKQVSDPDSSSRALLHAGLCLQFTLHDYKAAFATYLRAASGTAGSPSAMYRVGECYYGGIGTSYDRRKAMKWFKRGSRSQDELDPDASADLNCGHGPLECVAAMIASGDPDFEQRTWAVCGGTPSSAIVMLARAKLDPTRALKWKLQAAATGDPRAQFEAAEESEVPVAERLRLYRLSAAAGFTPAHEALGLMFAEGKLVPHDADLALQHYHKAADSGISDSQYRLARLLVQAGNHVEAHKWLARAAARQHGRAMFRLAQAYLNGDGVATDVRRALHLFSDCASSSVSHPPPAGCAELALGQIYIMKANKESASYWLSIAAKKCYVPAAVYSVAGCFEKGIGAAALVDERKAAKLYLKAANAGSADAMEVLADRYARGACSLPKDEAKAQEWADKRAGCARSATSKMNAPQ